MPASTQVRHKRCDGVWIRKARRPKQCPRCHRRLDYDSDLAHGDLVELVIAIEKAVSPKA